MMSIVVKAIGAVQVEFFLVLEGNFLPAILPKISRVVWTNSLAPQDGMPLAPDLPALFFCLIGFGLSTDFRRLQRFDKKPFFAVVKLWSHLSRPHEGAEVWWVGTVWAFATLVVLMVVEVVLEEVWQDIFWASKLKHDHSDRSTRSTAKILPF